MITLFCFTDLGKKKKHDWKERRIKKTGEKRTTKNDEYILVMNQLGNGMLSQQQGPTPPPTTNGSVMVNQDRFSGMIQVKY